jgi:hypothetical protein
MPFGIKEVNGEFLLSVVVFSYESESFKFWNSLLMCEHVQCHYMENININSSDTVKVAVTYDILENKSVA